MNIDDTDPAEAPSGPAPEASMLAGLEAAEFESLAARGERRTLTRGETLFHSGAPADALYFVLSGRFAVGEDGATESIAEIGQGEPIGEVGFFADVPRTYTVTAVRDSRVLTISREQFAAASDAAPGVRKAVIGALATRLARLRPGARRLPAPRTIAVIGAGERGVAPAFLDRLRQVFGDGSRAAFLTRESIAARFGGLSLDDPAAMNALNALEGATDFVVYVADETRSDWTDKCVRQADALMLVADASAGRRLNPIETFAFALHPPASRRLVILHEARSDVASGAASWLEGRDVAMLHHACLADAADVERLHRFVAGRAVGFVAGGGGALGSAHVGVYKAFCEAGAAFDAFGGTSVGAAMAAAMAMGLAPDAIDAATHRIFVERRAFGRLTVPYHSLLNHKNFDAALRDEYRGVRVEDLWRPFFAVSANLTDREAAVITRGELWRAVRASSSIPGVFPPFFTAEGKMLVDGGLIDNVPLSVMKALKGGPNLVVALQPDAQPSYPIDYDAIPGPGEWLVRALNPFARRQGPPVPTALQVIILSMLANRRRDLALDQTDLLIHPDLPPGAHWTSWSGHAEVYAAAYHGAAAAIAAKRAAGDAALAAVLGTGGGR